MARELRRTIIAVLLGVALFLGSYLVLDLGPLSDPERAELFEYSVAAPVILDLCAERSPGDPATFRQASAVAAGVLRPARDRSAAGLIAVPPGTTLVSELDRLAPEMAARVRTTLGDGLGPAQWQRVCGDMLADFRSAEAGWAQLQQKFPRQLRKLDLARPPG